MFKNCSEGLTDFQNSSFIVQATFCSPYNKKPPGRCVFRYKQKMLQAAGGGAGMCLVTFFVLVRKALLKYKNHFDIAHEKL